MQSKTPRRAGPRGKRSRGGRGGQVTVADDRGADPVLFISIYEELPVYLNVFLVKSS